MVTIKNFLFLIIKLISHRINVSSTNESTNQRISKSTSRTILIIISGLVIASCGKKNTEKPGVDDSTAIHYSVLNVLPHNAQAWTQGLVIHNNKILESTGQNNTSWIAEVNPASGQHEKKVTLDGEYFGEGITVLNNKIYQLTWTSKIGFIYDANTYKQIGEFPITTDKKNEGWGITHDNKNLIISDGSEKIYFLDTTSLKIIRKITVTDNGNRVKDLNELEYINGYIFANVWQTNWVLKIDPATGKVVGKLDLSSIGNEIKNMYPNADVLNGIAYDKNSRSLLITGKLWPKAYLIRINE